MYKFLPFVTALLVGCSAASKEEQCLQSDKLSFKDPGSLKVIANLGDRGQHGDLTKSFWIRYSATNGYGARVSANIACEVAADGTWRRSQEIEQHAITELTIAEMEAGSEVMEKRNAVLRGCKGDGACIDRAYGPQGKPYGTPEQQAAASLARATSNARLKVLDSPEPLAAQ